MAGHRLIDDHLAGLGRRLPDHIVEELADGLTETWEHHRAAGLAPSPAARAAIAEFGTIDQIIDAYVVDAPGRRTARLLLATGPLVGICWGIALAGTQVWTWDVPAAGAVLFAVALVAVVTSLAASATARRSYRRARLGAYGGLGLIALDLTMLATVLSAAPAYGPLTVFAMGASLSRIVLTAHAMPRTLEPLRR
jgi:hypothetical protein